MYFCQEKYFSLALLFYLHSQY